MATSSPLAYSSFALNLCRALARLRRVPALLITICLAYSSLAWAVPEVVYNGIQSSVAGPPWSGPVGVASDSAGNIYIGQYTGGNIIKVAAGTQATSTYLSGSVCSPAITLGGIQMMAMDSNNNLYIANQSTSQIVVWSTTSNTCKAYYSAPGVFAIALDSSNNIYFTQTPTAAVVKIAAGAANGTSGTAIVSFGLNYATGLALAPVTNAGLSAGDLLVADTNAGTVYRYTAASSFATRTTLASGLNQPFGVAFDSLGNLLVAETGNNDVLKYLASNYTSSVVEMTNVTGAEGIALDPSGNIFLTAYGGSTVTELSPSFAPVAVASTSPVLSVNFRIANGAHIGSFNVLDAARSSIQPPAPHAPRAPTQPLRPARSISFSRRPIREPVTAPSRLLTRVTISWPPVISAAQAPAPMQSPATIPPASKSQKSTRRWAAFKSKRLSTL